MYDNNPDKPNKVEKVTMYIICTEMALLIIALSITLVIVMRQAKFKFPVVLLILLIVADVCSFILALGLNAEDNTSYHREHKMVLAQVIGWTTFGFNFGTNCMHWLFSLKYWIIAKEVPKLLKGGTISFYERIYTFINILGIFINFVPCVMLAYVRGQLDYQSAGEEGQNLDSILTWVETLYHVINAL